MLFSHETGQLTALLDGTEVTTWKTAGDSALGSDLLSRQDSENFLMVGAGTMAEPLIRAHLTVRPNLKKIFLWNRTRQRCEQLAGKLADLSQSVELVDDLDKAAGEADIICCATMTNEPVLRGAWVSPGCHVDLVGAYKADMREVDDDMHARASWFVDSYDTTLHHIGELKIPLEQGVITKDAIKGDFHEIIAGDCGRASDAEITVLKNGGGAHLDVMVCSALARAFGN